MFKILQSLLIAVFFASAGAIISPSVAQAAACGGVNQPACSWSKARYSGKAQRCGRGQFYDIKRRECWSCPGGYKRTIFPLKGKKACQRRGKIVGHWSGARRHKSVGCRRPSFFDPRGGGQCWTCPSQYKRTIFPVHSKKACKARSACRAGLKKKRGYCVRKATKAGGKNGLLNIAKRDKQKLKRLTLALARALSPLGRADQIKLIAKLAKAKNPQALQRVLYRHPKINAALETLRFAGYRTMTVGIASSISIGIGGALETGVSMDTAKRNRPYIYQTRGYSGGLSLQVGNNIVISAYKASNDRIGNRPRKYFDKWSPSHGFVSSVDGLIAGVGIALWYDYSNRPQGFSVSYSLGSVGAQIWEYNRVETMIQ
ncbi:MAG: hypothetical protein ACRBBN_09320 [Methyloligellaceae bacterium]